MIHVAVASVGVTPIADSHLDPSITRYYQLFRDIVQRIDVQLAKFEELEKKDWDTFQRLIEK